MSSFVCALSNEGGGKPPPQAERGTRARWQQDLPISQDEVRCWGHQALPRSQELIVSPPWCWQLPKDERSVLCRAVLCRAVPCRAVLCHAVPCCPACAPAADSAPQAAFRTGTVPANQVPAGAGAQARAGSRSTRQVWAHDSTAPKCPACLVSEMIKKWIYRDATGHRAPRGVAVQGTVLSGCLWNSALSRYLNDLCLLFPS